MNLSKTLIGLGPDNNPRVIILLPSRHIHQLLWFDWSVMTMFLVIKLIHQFREAIGHHAGHNLLLGENYNIQATIYFMPNSTISSSTMVLNQFCRSHNNMEFHWKQMRILSLRCKQKQKLLWSHKRNLAVNQSHKASSTIELWENTEQLGSW